MTCHYPDLSSAFDWSCRVGNLIQPIRSTTQIWVVTRHQYGISALVSQTSFRGETSGEVAKCRLFSQDWFYDNIKRKTALNWKSFCLGGGGGGGSEHGYTLMVWFWRKLRVCMNVFIHRISSEWIRKKEKCASWKWILRNLICWRSNSRRLATTQPHEFLSGNGYRFQRPGLKTSVEIDIIWSEIGSWFGGLGSTPHPHRNSQENPPSLQIFINTMRIDLFG